jgi:hypothetical protein
MPEEKRTKEEFTRAKKLNVYRLQRTATVRVSIDVIAMNRKDAEARVETLMEDAFEVLPDDNCTICPDMSLIFEVESGHTHSGYRGTYRNEPPHTFHLDNVFNLDVTVQPNKMSLHSKTPLNKFTPEAIGRLITIDDFDEYVLERILNYPNK